MKPFAIGIVGCGGAAADLCRAIDKVHAAALFAAFDVTAQNARDLAEPRGAIVADSYERMLGSPAIDIVYIALPHDQLAAAAEAALLAGKHVLLEKPGAIAIADLVRIERLAASRGLHLGVMFVVRESAAVRLARDLVHSGAIGEVRQLRMSTVIDKPESYWASGPSGRVATTWRSSRATAGGGVVLMNSLHAIDAVRFVTGLEFTRASAELTTDVPGVEVEDAAAAVFRLSNGAIASLSAASHSAGATAQEGFEVDGEHGRLDVPSSPQRDRVSLFLRRRWGEHPSGQHLELTAPPRDPYTETLAAFVAALEARKPAPVGARDAAAALATVLAIYESSRTLSAVAIEWESADPGVDEHLLNSASRTPNPVDPADLAG